MEIALYVFMGLTIFFLSTTVCCAGKYIAATKENAELYRQLIEKNGKP